jgi:hypothetical protein
MLNGKGRSCHGSSLDLTVGHVTINIRVEGAILAHLEGAILAYSKGAILAHSEGATIHMSDFRLSTKLGIPLC